MSSKLHNSLLENVMNAPVNLYHEKTPLGKLLKYFTKDVDSCDRGFFDLFGWVSDSVFDCMLRIVFAISYSPYMALAAVFNFSQLYNLFDFTKDGAFEMQRVQEKVSIKRE